MELKVIGTGSKGNSRPFQLETRIETKEILSGIKKDDQFQTIPIRN